MNVLVIHEVSYEGKVVYEYQDLAERLAARGHRVFVIDFDAEGRYRSRGRTVSRTGAGNVELYSVPQANLPFFRLVTARLAYPRFLKKFIREKNISVIWLYSVFINGEGTLKVARECGVPVVYRVLDVYHQLRQNPWIKLPLLYGEKKIYREADHISVTNEKLGDYVTRLIAPSSRPKALSVLHHGVDTDFFQPRLKDPEFQSQLGITPEDRVVLFVGTLYLFSGLRQLLLEFSRSSYRDQRVKWLIVGDGDQMPVLKALVEEHGLQGSVFLLGRREYAEVPRWISIADVTLTPFELNPVTMDIVPIKILQYLAAGRPMVCAPIPDVMRMIPADASGVVYQNIAEPKLFLEKVMEIALNSTLRDSLQEQGRRFVLEHFAMENRVEALETLLLRYVERSQAS